MRPIARAQQSYDHQPILPAIEVNVPAGSATLLNIKPGLVPDMVTDMRELAQRLDTYRLQVGPTTVPGNERTVEPNAIEIRGLYGDSGNLMFIAGMLTVELFKKRQAEGETIDDFHNYYQ